MAERRAVTKEMARRCHKAPKKLKGVMLTELCALTGWSRDHARRALRTALEERAPRRRPRREPTYGTEIMEPLRKIWATLDGLCGKRLRPFMAEIVGVMERLGELELTPPQRDQLLQMSAATIDRRLSPDRLRLRIKGRSRTKPGTLMKHQVKIRTFSDWDEGRPGFVECDLVGHEGGNAQGDFCHRN